MARIEILKEILFEQDKHPTHVKRIHKIDADLIKDHHVLLIDDDPKFINHLKHFADACSLPLTALWPPFNVATLDERSFAPYTLLLVDFDLRTSNGLEIADYINLFIKRLPTILISSSLDFASEQGILPRYIDAFIPKSKGAVHILRHALKLASFLTLPSSSMPQDDRDQQLFASEF